MVTSCVMATSPHVMVSTIFSLHQALQRDEDIVTKPFETNVLVKAVKAVLGIEGGNQETGQDSLWEHDQ